MSGDLKDRFSAFGEKLMGQGSDLARKMSPVGEKLKVGGSAVGEKLMVGGSDLAKKMSGGMNSLSGKMREYFLVPTLADKFVEEATAETLDGPDWAKNLDLCDQVNHERLSGTDAVRAIKKRLVVKHPTVQMLALTLLETCVKNCDKFFSEVASERVLDEMVKLIDDRQSSTESRAKALKLIEAWGESTDELRYLPIFEETYKSLKNRGVKFPGRDNESLAPIFTPPGPTRNIASPIAGRGSRIRAQAEVPEDQPSVKESLDVARNSVELLSTVLSSSPEQEALKDDITQTLVEQCRLSQLDLQRIIQRAGDNDSNLFEALNLNDELSKVLSKYDDSAAAPNKQSTPPVATAPPLEVSRSVAPTFDEDELHAGGGDDTLVRNSQRVQHSSLSAQLDAQAMADLDEMIFGKRGGTP